MFGRKRDKSFGTEINYVVMKVKPDETCDLHQDTEKRQENRDDRTAKDIKHEEIIISQEKDSSSQRGRSLTNHAIQEKIPHSSSLNSHRIDF